MLGSGHSGDPQSATPATPTLCAACQPMKLGKRGVLNAFLAYNVWNLQ